MKWMSRTALFGVASLVLAACVATSPNGPNFDQGVWGTQTIKPAIGLLTAHQGPLIGRTITNQYGPSPLGIRYTLVDPSNGDARYGVVSKRGDSDYVPIPVSALNTSPSAITVTATDDELSKLPHYSLDRLLEKYPRTVLTPVQAPPAANVPGAAPTGVATTALPPSPSQGAASALPPGPSASSGSDAVKLVHSGGMVGYPVVDSSGQSIGTVNAVAVAPKTGEVRYIVVSSQNFGRGSYIVVPASSAQSSDGRVVVSGSAASWAQAPQHEDNQSQ